VDLQSDTSPPPSRSSVRLFTPDASVFEEWCESVVLCGFLSVLVTVKWSGLRKVP